MNIGDLYIAACPFIDRSGSKKRPIIILGILDDGIAVIESRSRSKSELTLALKIDFDRDPNYSATALSGVSHFYAENISILSVKEIQNGQFLDTLHDRDYATLSRVLGFPPTNKI